MELFENDVFRVNVWTDEKRNFSKTLTSHYQFQSTPRNIINLFKMAYRFLSLMLGLISNLTACLLFFKLTIPEGAEEEEAEG